MQLYLPMPRLTNLSFSNGQGHDSFPTAIICIPSTNLLLESFWTWLHHSQPVLCYQRRSNLLVGQLHRTILWSINGKMALRTQARMIKRGWYFDFCLSFLLNEQTYVSWYLMVPNLFRQYAVHCTPNLHSVMTRLWTYLAVWQPTKHFIPTCSLSISSAYIMDICSMKSWLQCYVTCNVKRKIIAI